MTTEVKAAIDIDMYFDRIGYHGSRAPTLDTLRAIHALHPQAIAFENLNPLSQLPVLLDLASLQDKLLVARRGGYCYEHNLLLKQVLEALGFRVRGLAARVMMNAPQDAMRARTHMLLLLDVGNEPWIADVGFGGLTPTAPLRLATDIEQATPHEPFRLTRLDEDYVLQAQVRGDWRALYRFDLQEQFLPDYELVSWYLSNHPQSYFVTELIAARAVPGCRYALSNNELAVHETGGETMLRKLTSVGELRSALEDTFGISLPGTPALDEALTRIMQASARSQNT